MNPQSSLVRVIRPPDGFETLYQGASIAVPIAFPGTLDPQAGKSGYDPTLLAGMAMPFGSRVTLYIPICFNSDDPDPAPDRNYTYQIFWRMRSVADYVDDMNRGTTPRDVTPFHFGTQELGAPNVNANPATRQFIIPAAMETIAFEQSEPGSTFTNGVVNLRGQLITPSGAPQTFGPLVSPGVSGDIQQGCFPSGNGGNPTGGAGYMTYVTDVQGDEMIIFAQRTVLTPDTWDFSSNLKDKDFSNTYGTDNNTRAVNPNLGIFVITGNM